jgi:hypothetical protein
MGAARISTPQSASSSGSAILIAAGVGGLVALTLGVYGSVHDPASDLAITMGFQSTIVMKVWLAAIALIFALAQLFSALWMYGKLPLGDAPANLRWVHRISGRIAFLFTLPVAYHCLYQLGFQDSDTRALAHSLFGCAFYGAFAAKIVIVRSRSLPGLALPVAGGLLFTILVATWLTSALWFITDSGGFPSP